MVIVNTPHNPTGRIYGPDALQALAELLDRASARIGRHLFLLSDEPYRRLRFDGRGFTSPAAGHSMLIEHPAMYAKYFVEFFHRGEGYRPQLRQSTAAADPAGAGHPGGDP